MYNNSNSSEFINEYITENNYCDVWRDRNPETERYSWFRKKTGSLERSASRIDLFLVNAGTAGLVKNTEYKCGCRTDHAMVTIEIENIS